VPRRKTSLQPTARKAAIFDLISQRGKASVNELAHRFDTSVETVRRDLSSLAVAGRVRKVHGGVVKIRPSEEGPFEDRIKQNTLAKQLVAEKLVKTISPGQSIMIDTGSTSLICAKEFSRIEGLTVITNSTRIAGIISVNDNNSHAFLLGGTYKHDNAQTVGSATISEIAQYSVDHVILTIRALDFQGAYDFSEEEAEVARAMVNNAEHVTIVADSTKLNNRSTFQVCDLNKIDRLILDQAPELELQRVLDAVGVEVL